MLAFLTAPPPRSRSTSNSISFKIEQRTPPPSWTAMRNLAIVVVVSAQIMLILFAAHDFKEEALLWLCISKTRPLLFEGQLLWQRNCYWLLVVSVCGESSFLSCCCYDDDDVISYIVVILRSLTRSCHLVQQFLTSLWKQNPFISSSSCCRHFLPSVVVSTTAASSQHYCCLFLQMARMHDIPAVTAHRRRPARPWSQIHYFVLEEYFLPAFKFIGVILIMQWSTFARRKQGILWKRGIAKYHE
jgi:hypothetical protein